MCVVHTVCELTHGVQHYTVVPFAYNMKKFPSLEYFTLTPWLAWLTNMRYAPSSSQPSLPSPSSPPSSSSLSSSSPPPLPSLSLPCQGPQDLRSYLNPPWYHNNTPWDLGDSYYDDAILKGAAAFVIDILRRKTTVVLTQIKMVPAKVSKLRWSGTQVLKLKQKTRAPAGQMIIDRSPSYSTIFKWLLGKWNGSSLDCTRGQSSALDHPSP